MLPTLDEQCHPLLLDSSDVDGGARVCGRVLRIGVEDLKASGLADEVVGVDLRHPHTVLRPGYLRLRVPAHLARETHRVTLGDSDIRRRIFYGWRN